MNTIAAMNHLSKNFQFTLMGGTGRENELRFFLILGFVTVDIFFVNKYS